MNRAYVIVPLAAVIVFGGIYWSYSSRREAFIRQHEEQVLAAQRAEQERVQRERAASVESANAALAQRQAERRDKEQREAAQKQAQADAESRRDRAFEQERKLRSQIDRRRAEIERATERLTLLAARQRDLTEEKAFLDTCVPQTEANRDSFYRLLEKWEQAERAKAAAVPPATASSNPGHS